MSPLRASEVRIRRRVEPLLAESQTLPVDAAAIAARLGAEVRELELAPDICGILYWEDERKVLVTNALHPPGRRRVSLARQIGHIVLHRRMNVRTDQGLKIDVRAPLEGTLESIEEVEASIFAVNLLIPAAWLQHIMTSSVFDFSDDQTLAALAAQCCVPTSTMTLRLLLLSDR